jgi:hypothetical protein
LTTPGQESLPHIDLNITKDNQRDKESAPVSFDKNKLPESGIPDDIPIETKEDAIKVWNKARELWNRHGLKPTCRDLTMRGVDTAEILQTFQFYSWTEVKDAIENYVWHKFKAGPGFRSPPPYGNLAGFLKTGVEKYHDGDSLDQQFKDARS